MPSFGSVSTHDARAGAYNCGRRSARVMHRLRCSFTRINKMNGRTIGPGVGAIRLAEPTPKPLAKICGGGWLRGDEEVLMKKVINEILCPCCKKPLYRTVTNESGINEMVIGSSYLEMDQIGPFMRRQRCSRRVVFEPMPNLPGSPSQWRPADIQDCVYPPRRS